MPSDTGRTGRPRDPMLAALALTGMRGRALAVPILLGVAGALAALGLAALSAWLITRAWQMPPVLYLSVAVTAVRGLGIGRGVFRYLERLATHDVALAAMARARVRVYRALADGDAARTVGLRRAELLSRTADDVDEIGSAVIRGLVPMAVGAVTSLSAVAIMASVSPPAALVLAAALLASGVVAPRWATHGAARRVRAAARAREDAAQAATTLLWHGPELAVTGSREAMLAAVRDADRRTEDAQEGGMRWQAAAQAVTPLSLAVSVMAAAIIAVDLASGLTGSLADVSSGDGVTPMVFGVLLLLPLSSFETTAALTEAGLAWESGRQAARRVLDLIGGDVDAAGGGGDVDAAGGGGDPTVDPRPVTLTARDLRWGWDETIGGPLDVDLPPGARLVVTGPSGVGKSTLLLTLAGLLPARSGRTLVSGDTGASGDPRRSVVYLAQDAHVFSTTVRENLRVARGDATETEMLAAVERVGLGPWLRGLPDGLDTVLTGGESAVSGGQRRRLLLARGLLHPAPIVVLDEPTEHLDAADAAAVLAALCADGESSLFGSRTVVVVTHQDVTGIAAPVLRLTSERAADVSARNGEPVGLSR